MSDRELAEFFKRPPSSVCGHFQMEQLDRDLVIPRKRIPWIKYFFQITLPVFLFSMKASAQGKVEVVKKVNTQPSEMLMGMIATPISKKASDNEIRGKVLDENGLPLFGATVLVKGKNYATVTDKKGNFFMITPPLEKCTLIVSYVGYELKEVTGSSSPQTIILEAAKGTLDGEVLIVSRKTVEQKKKSNKKEKKIEQPQKEMVLPEEFRCVIPKEGLTDLSQPVDLKLKETQPVELQQALAGKITCLTVVEEKSSTTRSPTTIEKIRYIVDTAFSSFSVYPNPIFPGTSFNIHFKKFVQGNYVLSVINTAGEVVQTKEVVIENKTGAIETVLNATAAGIYFIRLSNKKSGKTYSEKIVVQ